MRNHAWIFALVLTLSGCGGGAGESLDSFTQRWYAAINQRHVEELYDMLDAASQRRIRHDLEVMRGLPAKEQQDAINQLGGMRVKSLLELTPQKYFALLWDRATAGKRPTMSIEARGGESAYMVLALEGGRPQRIRLALEGGRWVWALPWQVSG